MSLSDAPDDMQLGFTILGNPDGNDRSLQDRIDQEGPCTNPYALIQTIRGDVRTDRVIKEQGGTSALLKRALKNG